MERYYDPGHHKFNIHQLSHRILKSKKENSQDELFANVLGGMIQFASPDGVTRVPPRPSKERDRLKPMVTLVFQVHLWLLIYVTH